MSKIEWTNETWNPLRGCRRISPGCEHCYAERQALRVQRMTAGMGPYQGLVQLGKQGARWTGETAGPDLLGLPLGWKKPRRVFPCSMSDLFFEGHRDDDIARVFAVMAACPQHTFQVLTKRAERMARWFAGTSFYTGFDRTAFFSDFDRFPVSPDPANTNRLQAAGVRWPLPNVWIGVSVEDQQRAEERLPHLLQVPAALRFVSYEPGLEGVDFTPWLPPVFPDIGCKNECGFIAAGNGLQCLEGSACRRYLHPGDQGHAAVADYHRRVDKPGIDWLIVGGESGHGARAFDLAWARGAVTQFKAARRPVFVKQLGAVPVMSEAEWRAAPSQHLLNHRVRNEPAGTVALKYRDKKGGDMDEWPEDLRVREFPGAPTPSAEAA